MKWIVIASFMVYLAAFSEGSALRCSRGTNNDCHADSSEKERESNLDSKKTECLAGSEWDSLCHRCRCSEDGQPECVRLDSCREETKGEPMVCRPLTEFRRDCNLCICLESGLGSSCTTIECAPKSVLSNGKECKIGTEWQSQCNNCSCSNDGMPMCTDMACPGQEDEPEMLCAPGTSWKLDCNTCYCPPTGRAACTRIGCGLYPVTDFNPDNGDDDTPKPVTSLLRKARATSQATLKACQPGQEFRMDCNKCLCNNEGQDYSCTRINCAELNSNGNNGARAKREVATQVKADCVPGSVFKQGCNTCQCTEDGNHATCTIKRCKEDNPDENEVNLPESDPSFRCNPGEQFKRGCNDCACSADGKSVFCALRLCDQDITLTI